MTTMNNGDGMSSPRDNVPPQQTIKPYGATGSKETVTLKDLAQRLGIHPSTVSRVLHSTADVSRAAASPATAKRIRKLAAELGYSPDPHAAGLRTGRTKLLGVVVPQLSDLVLALMYQGVEEAAAKLGYSTFVSNSRDDPEEQQRKVEMMLARRVDGIIVGDAHLEGDLLPALSERSVPFTLMNRRHPGYPSSTCNDMLGGSLVAEHFWDRGHRNVAIIAGEPYASTAVDRTAGFTRRWRGLGGRLSRDATVWSRFDTTGGRTATEKLLGRKGPLPTAIFVVNDFAAIGAMGVLRSRGITVGQDVAMVGFNDIPLAAELPIPLSSVRSPMVEIGGHSVRMLHSLLGGEDVQSVQFEPTLQLRESSV